MSLILNEESNFKDVSIQEKMDILSEGKYEVSLFLQKMYKRYFDDLDKMVEYLNIFHTCGIYGKHLVALYEDACLEDWDLFEKTMNVIGEDKISRKEIHKNLSRLIPSPFKI